MSPFPRQQADWFKLKQASARLVSAARRLSTVYRQPLGQGRLTSAIIHTMRWDVSKALKNNLVLLSGDEHLLRSRALRDLLSQCADEDAFDLETFVADSSSPSEWFASAGTSPFLSPRRTVVVRNLVRSEAYKEMPPAKLPETAMVILVADDEVGDYDKQRRLEGIRKGWEKAVSDRGGESYFFKIDPKELIQRIKAEADSLGKKITDRAADALREMVGGSLSRAQEELEKLAIFVSSEKINEQDVRSVVLAAPEWNVFRMVDAISRGEPADALRQLRMVIGSSQKVEEVAFRSLLPTLSNQLRLLWQCRICIERRLDPTELSEEVRAKLPAKPNLATEGEWRRNKAMQMARQMSLGCLAVCFQAVADCDSRLKGQLPSFSGIETLERMVLEMIQACR